MSPGESPRRAPRSARGLVKNMDNQWYNDNERKESHFTPPQKALLVFSPSLQGGLSYGVGRSKDRSEPAFAFCRWR